MITVGLLYLMFLRVLTVSARWALVSESEPESCRRISWESHLQMIGLALIHSCAGKNWQNPVKTSDHNNTLSIQIQPFFFSHPLPAVATVFSDIISTISLLCPFFHRQSQQWTQRHHQLCSDVKEEVQIAFTSQTDIKECSSAFIIRPLCLWKTDKLISSDTKVLHIMSFFADDVNK